MTAKKWSRRPPDAPGWWHNAWLDKNGRKCTGTFHLTAAKVRDITFYPGLYAGPFEAKPKFRAIYPDPEP